VAFEIGKLKAEDYVSPTPLGSAKPCGTRRNSRPFLVGQLTTSPGQRARIT